MPELQQLRPDHASAVLTFEIENRAFFAAAVGDRGDEYFEHFTELHDRRLAEQVAGEGAYRLAAQRHGIRTLRAATTRDNTASQKVLLTCGFVPIGPADPKNIGGKPGTVYTLDLPDA